MVNVSYDHEHNTVIVEFKGNIDAAQAEQFFSDIEQVLPRHGKGFKLLTDFSSVEAMDLAVQRGIKKAELFNGRGVTDRHSGHFCRRGECRRILPDELLHAQRPLPR
jgi:hypothetical protein